MTLSVVLNTILGIGVVVMVVAPLAWAIRTQHRDHPELVATEAGPAEPAGSSLQAQRRRRSSQPAYNKPVTGRA